MSESFIIEGGNSLKGSVRVGGAKNASWKLMIGSLLSEGESRLLNFSHISDVEVVSEIINQLGGKAEKKGERAIFIDPTALSKFEITHPQGAQGRFSTMFIPVLLHRFGHARVPAPGGDQIGKRPLERHFDGLKALGATLEWKDGFFEAKAEHLKGARYTFQKNSHTGTETMILAAVKAQGVTVLENAATEPEIDDLIAFLNGMGAQIKRSHNRVITIVGVPELQGNIYKIMPDRNEVVSYACAALATKGDVVVENAKAEHLESFLETLKAIGAGYEIGSYGIRFFYYKPLQATNVSTEIHPGFMTDWQPLLATLLTQCQGTSVIHETIMSSRFQYVPALQEMGAKISYFQPELENPEEVYNFNLADDEPNAQHAIAISGPTPLKSGSFEVLDLRHGSTLVIAALVAQGSSTISNIVHIDRGYEDLDGRLRSIGAKIERRG